MSPVLPDNFAVFPAGARLVPDPRLKYLTPEQRRRFLSAEPQRDVLHFFQKYL